jgi:flagellar biosynthesis chaperone FliJ
MAEERSITLSVLAKFHREVILPDIQRVVGDAERRLRDEMHTGFDAVAQRLDRLETEYHMLVAGLKRVEERLETLSEAQEKYALRSDLGTLKARVEALQEQIRQVEERLDD